MKYLILTQPSIEYAEGISERIWIARYPEEVRLGDEETSKYCGYIIHPTSGDVALAFPDEVIEIHPMRRFAPLAEYIKLPFLTQEQKDGINDHFENLFPRDENDPPLTIEHALPPLYAANLKDEAYMESNNWFVEP